tara:strand:+ start:361 stop:516 length:156 start_codon:yes stop_codon:yes gene_type:complete
VLEIDLKEMFDQDSNKHQDSTPNQEEQVEQIMILTQSMMDINTGGHQTKKM